MKPLVLLLVNTGFWSVGEIGRQIIRRFRHKYDFLFLPERVVSRRADMLNEALRRADLVCCLNESGAPLLRRFAGVPIPPVISWIHHITSWGEDHEIAARDSEVIISDTPEWRTRIASAASHSRVETVGLGVDLDYFAPKQVSRVKLGLPEKGFLVGFFGARGSDADASKCVLLVKNHVPSHPARVDRLQFLEIAAGLGRRPKPSSPRMPVSAVGPP